MEKFKLQVYSELCCELCNEIIHNHIDCPVCDTKEGYQPTDNYCDLTGEAQVVCDVCKTRFELEEGNWYGEHVCSIKNE